MRPIRSFLSGPGAGGASGWAGAARALLIASVVLASAGCADRRSGEDAAPNEARRPAVSSGASESAGLGAPRSAGMGGSGAAPGAPARATEPGSPFTNFPSIEGLPDAPPPWRRSRLRLVNGGREPLVVRARSGADAVLVDTLAAGDSVEVELRLRADSVTLLAERPAAGGVTTRHLATLPDTLVRVPLP